MTERKQDPKVVTYILGLFHLDKLCPKCGGPMERKNLDRCNTCDFRFNLRIHLESIDTGIMSIRHRSGLRKPPTVHQIQKAPQPKNKPIKKKNKKNNKEKTRQENQVTDPINIQTKE